MLQVSPGVLENDQGQLSGLELSCVPEIMGTGTEQCWWKQRGERCSEEEDILEDWWASVSWGRHSALSLTGSKNLTESNQESEF